MRLAADFVPEFVVDLVVVPGLDAGWQLLVVAAAGLAAGAANAIAGGGSALSFPILVMLGVPPVAANATSALGLVPGSAAASWSYRGELRTARPVMLWLAVPSLLGGAVGAWLLVHLPAHWFSTAAPWFVITAAGSVALEPAARRWLRAGAATTSGPRSVARPWVAGMAAWLGIALYGGYFGAGMGMLILTTLGLLGVRNLQHANGLKNLLTVAIKAPALAYFIALGLPVWSAAAALAAGAVTGGWVAGHLIQRVDAERLRWVVASVGAALGVSMLLR